MKICFLIIIAILLTSCTSLYKQLYQKKPEFYSHVIGDVQNNYIYKEHYLKGHCQVNASFALI